MPVLCVPMWVLFVGDWKLVIRKIKGLPSTNNHQCLMKLLKKATFGGWIRGICGISSALGNIHGISPPNSGISWWTTDFPMKAIKVFHGYLLNNWKMADTNDVCCCRRRCRCRCFHLIFSLNQLNLSFYYRQDPTRVSTESGTTKIEYQCVWFW